MGRALGADGAATTALASLFGGSPTTTYAENIGVMGATRVYSTAAYYVAAAVAILLGLCPKFGVLVGAIPGGVLGGITLVLYGMIALVGAPRSGWRTGWTSASPATSSASRRAWSPASAASRWTWATGSSWAASRSAPSW
nr:solute carrier family 23 protein [Pseudonocardia sp. ICBG601]